jgi:thiamine-phosphate pyrophosphorylase
LTAARPPQAPLIAAVTDRRLLGRTEEEARKQLAPWAASVAEAGADIIQIRERGLTDATLLAVTREVRGAIVGTACRLLVNDRVDIALAAGAAGVHLPTAAMPPARVRRIAPEQFAIGRSIHSPDDAVAAEQGGGCDYLLFGTVFESGSKPSDHRVAGVESLRRACASVALPVLAIGGVTVDRAEDLGRVGASGAAAIRLFAEPWQSLPRREAGTRLAEIIGSLRRAFARAASSRPSTFTDVPDGS